MACLRSPNQKLTASNGTSNTELPTPEIINMEYDIKTYRGPSTRINGNGRRRWFLMLLIINEHLNGVGY